MLKSFFCLFSLFVIYILFNSCGAPQGPTEQDIEKIVEQKNQNNLILEIQIIERGKPKKIEDQYVFPITVKYDYIIQGLAYGNVSGSSRSYHSYSGRACNDHEYTAKVTYLIAKDNFDVWYVYETRYIEDKEIAEYWRPENQSMEEFYRGRIKY